ncbi:hypothetical protein TDB9533_01454 [Thalassocella blandensis]|nr:hypothetical protein TDB9533_01454 [Thalassocella blandensis]
MADRTPIKPTPTKAECREALSRQVDSFLASGGEVKSIPSGVSGNDANVNLFTRSASFEPRKERTPVTDVIKVLEERKSSKTKQLKSRRAGPKKKLITDDFGEPVRWVWVDDE